MQIFYLELETTLTSGSNICIWDQYCYSKRMWLYLNLNWAKYQICKNHISQYGSWNKMLICFTPVFFTWSCCEFGRPPSCRKDSLHAPRNLTVTPDWCTGAWLWFDRPLNAARAALQWWLGLSHLRLPKNIVLCASLEYSTNVPSPQTRHTADPFPVCPEIKVYAGKSCIVQMSMPRSMKLLFGPTGSDMSVACTPTQSFLSSCTSGCK